jgi:molybdopterin-guanine dinucleotide biosynthesis protein A
VRIIDRVAAALGAVTDRLIVISNAADAGAWLPGVPAIADARPERGSLVGIHSALGHAREAVFVVAWDMPFVDAALTTLVRARFTRDDDAAVPCGASGPEPFCAIYAPSCLPYIDAAIAAGDLGVSKLVARLPRVTYIPAADVATLGDPTRIFFNVNDARDLVAAESMLYPSPRTPRETE